MEIKIITIFCICYDYLKDINFKEDSQCKMNTAEIMTIVLTATLNQYKAFTKYKFNKIQIKDFLKYL